MSVFRYRINAPFVLDVPDLAHVVYAGLWLQIEQGRLCISDGYAWDGCSPSWRLPGGLWVGPWDGPLGESGRPVSWRASLVHDALCQFRSDISGLTKSITVSLFARLLHEDGAPWWMTQAYPLAIDQLGPQRWS